MVRFLIDENLNHRILRGVALRVPVLDYVVAQNTGLGGLDDVALMAWAAKGHRVIVTHDLKTIPKMAYELVQLGDPMPGVIAVPDKMSIGQVIEDLTLLINCCDEAELENLVAYLPL